MTRLSIILRCHNHVEVTQHCLESFVANEPSSEYEFIVVNDASTDETSEFLKSLEGNVVVENLDVFSGFGHANNIGAKHATGDYLVFLRPEAVFSSDSISELLKAFDVMPTLGAASSLAAYSGGYGLAAGASMFRNAEIIPYGHDFAFQYDPRAVINRRVDVVDSHCLVVDAGLFRRIGGFNESYSSPEFACAELSFQLHGLGFETQSIGTSQVQVSEDLPSDANHEADQKLFVSQWGAELLTRPTFAEVSEDEWAHRPESDDKKSILVLDPQAPMYDRSSGHQRLWNLLTQLREEGHAVTYISHSTWEMSRMKKELGQLGIVLYGGDPGHVGEYSVDHMHKVVKPSLSPDFSILAARQRFDVVYISFWHLAEKALPLVRQLWPEASVVVDSVDIQYLRERRSAELSGNSSEIKKADEIKRRELATYAAADRVVCITRDEENLLKTALPEIETLIIPNTHALIDSGPAWAERRDLLFVGNFSHPPNIDALRWWTNEIEPILATKLPGVRLNVFGNDPEDRAKEFGSENVLVHGHVRDLTPELHRARISVAPLRVGAGMKGKVGEAMSAALPVVCTSIAAEGMDLVDGEHVLLANDAATFAERIVDLYNDELKWNSIRFASQAAVAERWSPESLRNVIPLLIGKKTMAGVR